MARPLRFNGTGSDVVGCPAVHEDLDSGEIVIHGNDDNLLNVELITEPVAVNRYLQVRDAAWHYAVRYDTFAAGLTT